MKEFEQIYATAAKYSWTSAPQFKKFCDNAEIRCDELVADRYFKSKMCDGAFLTTEYTYDAQILRDHFLSELSKHSNVEIIYNAPIVQIEKSIGEYIVSYHSDRVSAPFVLNATYSGVNQIQKLAGFEPFRIKYELCEIILCKVSENFRNIGFTVMDGPFFSIMPFGKTGYHSLTSVTFTPHITSFEPFPSFPCQKDVGGYCTAERLGNCNDCIAKPKSAWAYMSNLARKYLRDEYGFTYEKSLFSMKPILMASEIDDSRPTVIKVNSEAPTFVSVLSGKINTVYDLEELLRNDKK